MINSWLSIDYDSFAIWRIKGLKIFDFQELTHFTKLFLSLGEKYETFILSQAKDINEKLSNTELYLQQLEAYYNKTKKYYSINYPALNSVLKGNMIFFQKSVIWSYNSYGNISKYYVSNTGEILRTINPGIDLSSEDFKSNYLADIPPIFIPSVGFNTKAGVSLSIYLHTNIYFPKINPSFQVSESLVSDDGYIDNSELAQLNSANFNKWFKELTILINDYGGSLLVDNSGGLPKIHKQYVSINGIVI